MGKGAVMPEVEKEGTEKEAATRKTLGYPLLWGGNRPLEVVLRSSWHKPFFGTSSRDLRKVERLKRAECPGP